MKIRSGICFIVVALLLMTSLAVVIDNEPSEAQNYVLSPSYHAYSDGQDYCGTSDNGNPTGKLSSLKITGFEKYSKNNGIAYFNFSEDTTSISINIVFSITLKKNNGVGNGYYLSYDTASSVGSTKLSAKIGTGALIVQTSDDRITWKNVNTYTSMSGTNKSFSLNSGDFGNEKYVRVQFAYEIYKHYGFLNLGTTCYNIMEEYVFHISTKDSSDSSSGTVLNDFTGNYVIDSGSSKTISGRYHAYDDNKGYKGSSDNGKPTSNIASVTVSGITGSDTYEGTSAVYLNTTSQDPYIHYSIYFRQYSKDADLGNGYHLSEDTWDSDFADVSNKSRIGTMKLVVSTSTDGMNWDNKGVFGVNTHYVNKDITLSTKEVGKGVYVRIMVAYEIYTLGGLFGWFRTATYNVLETYTFYAEINCSSAVTYTNLTNSENSSDSFESDSIESFKTLSDGAYTTTGFNVEHVKLSGMNLNVIFNDTTRLDIGDYIKYYGSDYIFTFTESGKYSIYLTDTMDILRTTPITIHIHKLADIESNLFHGEAVSMESRVEGFSSSLPSFKMPVSFFMYQSTGMTQIFEATIRNASLGTEQTIDSTHDNAVELTSDGINHYVITVTQKDEIRTGDAITFVFSFYVLGEDTYSPPHYNKELLENSYFAGNLNTEYYGLSTPTKGNGSVIWAFDTFAHAQTFAVEYQYTFAEKINDQYRWAGKQYSNSWELTAALNEWASKNITLRTFDVSEASTIASLDVSEYGGSEKWAVKDYCALYLTNDVIMFTNESMRDALICSNIPVIANKPYVYLSDGKIETEIVPTKFVTDDDLITSSLINISNDAGLSYDVRYNEDVVSQLTDAGFDECVVHINEYSNGGQISYDAYFIPADSAPCKGNVTVLSSDNKDTAAIADKHTYTGNRISLSLSADSALNSHAYVYDGIKTAHMDLTELNKQEFSSPGTYQIKIVNCIGSVINITLKVEA